MLWNFSQLVPESRRSELLLVASFEDIVVRIAAGSVDLFFAEPRQSSPGIGCYRAFFRVRIPERDYDAFFNSPVDYRAQYCVSVEQGERHNRKIIDGITPICLSFAQGIESREFPAALIQASLRAVGAKVWIDEADLPDVDEIHIEYPPWIVKARAAGQGTLADQEARSHAFAGVLAPVGTHIEVKGGWIKPEGGEWLDPGKATRAQEIHDYGFT